MRGMSEASVDSIVTDPPYHLTTNKKGGSGEASVNLDSPYGRARIGTGFMGMKWDGGDVAMRVETWREMLRVLKPGGYLLAFGGTRTFHRMACAIEDAGFELRDTIMWVYGSGFPKSHNGDWGGTALKPAWEPIVMARKAPIGTVEKSWAIHGVGGLNIDGCRVPGEPTHGSNRAAGGYSGLLGEAPARGVPNAINTDGRWPANLIHDGDSEVLAAFPQAPVTRRNADAERLTLGAFKGGPAASDQRDGGGNAARFFYCAKASKVDREEGNSHPTVKPTELMRYLCRLVTPPGGTVFDPFTGSGSTGKAATLEGFDFIGCELSPEYAAIAEARIAPLVLW